MTKVQIILQELETLSFEELWAVWEYLQQRIKTFLLENFEKTPTEKKYLQLSDFSFAKAQAVLKDYKGSLSDAVIEERRSYV